MMKRCSSVSQSLIGTVANALTRRNDMKKETFENPYKEYLNMQEYLIEHDEYPCEYCRQNLKSKLWKCTLIGLEHGVNPCRAKEKNVCRLAMDERYDK